MRERPIPAAAHRSFSCAAVRARVLASAPISARRRTHHPPLTRARVPFSRHIAVGRP